MYLKRLELLGFKSFASKTVLELDRGMTALVGPNGSGKSNVVDAIRWVLGEQSLRAVRSRKSEEVIFSGNGLRSALGMAEVSIVLDNAEGGLPVPFSEVSITRRQYRSGDGEYLINRTRVRLRDVVELLSHAGLGPDSYAVVGQGAVDEVLLQRPEERRVLLETAADISRHQLKLRESLDRLKETEANILRVEDIRVEIAPRLSKLRAQANRARRHGELVSRLEGTLRWHHLLAIRGAREQAVADMDLEGERRTTAAEATRLRESAQRRVAQLADRLKEEEATLALARERLNALRLARARSEREAALRREREASCRRQLAQAEDDLARTREERRQLEEEVALLAASRADLAEQENGVRRESAAVESEWRSAASEQRLIQAQLDRVSGDQHAATRRKSELRERCEALLRESRRAESARVESLRAAAEAAARLEGLETRLETSRLSLDRLRADLSTAETDREERQGRLVSAVQELDAVRKREREAWELAKGLQSRLELLRLLKGEQRGVPDGARAILHAGLPGIRGTLATMFRVPGEYIQAVAAALGEAQCYVVSEGLREGLGALEFLTVHPGRATIAPLRLDDWQPSRPPVDELRSGLAGLLDGIDFHGLAADLVSCPPEAKDLCIRYLGLSVVVGGLADALEICRRLVRASDGRLPFQVVTLDGRLVRARGDLASADAGEGDGALLAREAELLSLSESAELARVRHEEVGGLVAALESTRSSLSQEIAATQARASGLRNEVARLEAADAETMGQVARVEAAIEWHRSRAAAVEREGSHAQEVLVRVEQEMVEIAKREKDASTRSEQLRDDLRAQEAILAEISARRSRLGQDAAALRNKLRELEVRKSAITEAIQRCDAWIGQQEGRVAALSEELVRLNQDSLDGLAVSLAEEMASAEGFVAAGVSRVAQLKQGCVAAESELSDRTCSQEMAREELSEARSREQRSSVELAALIREAMRELSSLGAADADSGGGEAPAETGGEGVPSPPAGHRGRGGGALPVAAAEASTLVGGVPECQDRVGVLDRLSATGQPSIVMEAADEILNRLGSLLAEEPADPPPADAAVASRRAEALRRELQSLGTVNADAPEEYLLVSQRHSFLTSQLDDLRQAERSLRKAIDDLKRAMELRFGDTFSLVGAEFTRCFTTLFGGGSASLVLTKPDQPLEGGVEIMAVPPGRRAGSLLGLSGGERALTAVALLFALMKVNPSPFCVLDEVDAALDESNVRRFCDMVRQLMDRTQFLLITHNRGTMEVANALHGVSMSPESVSRVVSLRLTSEPAGAGHQAAVPGGP